MSRLFTAASSFASDNAQSRRTCYWYGAATMAGDTIVPQPADNPCQCVVPPPLPAAGAAIGWPAREGFALVGRDAGQEALAYSDCTGFAAWLIASTSASDFHAFLHWADVQHVVRHDQPWPSAAAYAYVGYAAQPIGGKWSVVVNGIASPQEWMQRLQPGDLLAWDIRNAPGQVNDTGHVMVLGSSLTPAGEALYRVEVIDCSRYVHGDDSRPPGTSGVGTGTILLRYVDGEWQYSFGTAEDGFHHAPHLSVLRLDV